jgi:uncharacterized protein
MLGHGRQYAFAARRPAILNGRIINYRPAFLLFARETYMRSAMTMAAVLLAVSVAAGAGEQSVAISGGKAPLYGTLTLPAGDGKVPAVLIVAGSGPTDRDGNNPLGVKAGSYRLLAEGLAADGIASLRFDKRGIGQSAAAMTAEADLRFDDSVADAVAWTDFLRAQPRVSCVVILGHSEGSLVGMIAATEAKVCGYISVSGLARDGADVLADQLTANPNLPAALLAQARTDLASLKAGRTVAAPPPALAALFRPSVQPYLISWFAKDPTKILAAVTVPVLIVQGTHDIQVPVSEAKTLAAAKPDAKLVLLDGVNHILKAAPEERNANVATYANPALPLAPGVVPAIAEFVRGAAK